MIVRRAILPLSLLALLSCQLVAASVRLGCFETEPANSASYRTTTTMGYVLALSTDADSKIHAFLQLDRLKNEQGQTPCEMADGIKECGASRRARGDCCRLCSDEQRT